MRSGYKVIWTNKALTNLDAIIKYLTENWTEKEISKFFNKLENRITIISKNPTLYPTTSNRIDVRRSVLIPQITIYYRIKNQTIEILTLFDTRQNPLKRS